MHADSRADRRAAEPAPLTRKLAPAFRTGQLFTHSSRLCHEALVGGRLGELERDGHLACLRIPARHGQQRPCFSKVYLGGGIREGLAGGGGRSGCRA